MQIFSSPSFNNTNSTANPQFYGGPNAGLERTGRKRLTSDEARLASIARRDELSKLAAEWEPIWPQATRPHFPSVRSLSRPRDREEDNMFREHDKHLDVFNNSINSLLSIKPATATKARVNGSSNYFDTILKEVEETVEKGAKSAQALRKRKDAGLQFRQEQYENEMH